jgi:CubicO group peptidase (beta-lactamase class C family)
MQKPTRRMFLEQVGITLGLHSSIGLSSTLAAPTEPKPTANQLAQIQQHASAFLTKYNAPGLSVAIARHGQMVLNSAFGRADITTNTPLKPQHLFRIASVAKPITSTAIFKLIEDRKFQLNSQVFGSGGLLADEYGNDLPADVKTITIQHLLTHTSGGWGPKRDPMFRNIHDPHHTLIARTIKSQALDTKPGTHFDYSNFGYCILGRVIEKITQTPYETFVQNNLLAKCGIHTMKIAGNTLADRIENEVRYQGQNGEDPYNMNIRRMDSHGGWLASAHDLVRFATHVDGFTTSPSLLKPETIQIMTTPSQVNPNYGCGWNVNSAPNWWHGGSLSGTSSVMARIATGLCWAALVNTRTKGIDLALDQLLWQIAQTVPAWKA